MTSRTYGRTIACVAVNAAKWHTRMAMPKANSKTATKRAPAKKTTSKATAAKPIKASVYTVPSRTPIEEAAAAMVKRAKKRPLVVAMFNDVELRATPDTLAEAIVLAYQDGYRTAHGHGPIPMESDPTPTAMSKLRRNAYREAALKGPRDAWVKAIKDPKQRALADAVPRVCDLFGIKPDVLRMPRKDQSPESRNENDMRMIALGALVNLGVSLGMAWNEIHCDPDTGRCEVLDMPAHAFTIRQAHARWLAIQGQAGQVQEMVRSRYEAIRQAVATHAA
jgi:hypothetical protein